MRQAKTCEDCIYQLCGVCVCYNHMEVQDDEPVGFVCPLDYGNKTAEQCLMDKIKRMYIKQQMTTQAIADEIGKSQSFVYQRLSKHGLIEERTRYFSASTGDKICR